MQAIDGGGKYFGFWYLILPHIIGTFPQTNEMAKVLLFGLTGLAMMDIGKPTRHKAKDA